MERTLALLAERKVAERLPSLLEQEIVPGEQPTPVLPVLNAGGCTRQLWSPRSRASHSSEPGAPRCVRLRSSRACHPRKKG